VPSGETSDEWQPVLHANLLELGFEEVEEDSWDE
jgi:hypothetical protein